MRRALISLLLGLTAHALAENGELDPRYSDWYQIEVLVFERSSANYLEEAWPKDIKLSYPPRVHRLYTLDAWRQRAQEQGSPDAADDISVAGTETPFIVLDKDQRALNSAALRLQRSGKPILFHESWRQALGATKDAIPVLLQGGQQFGTHYELEGTIKIGVDRYLHVLPDIWRTRFALNYGQPDPFWPALPELVTTAEHGVDSDQPTSRRGVYSDELSFSDTVSSRQRSAQNTSGLVLSVDELSLETDERQRLRSIDEKPYLIEEIVSLRQARRMRSSELHYIDHPRLGILVLIKPLKVPQSSDHR